MFSFQSKTYAAVIVSFILLLFSIILSYQNIQSSNSILKHLSRDQIKLNYYASKLNYDIKEHQTDILQVTLLKGNFTAEQEEKIYKEIQNSLTQLQEYMLTNPNLPKEFADLLELMSARVQAFKIIQHSLIEAVDLQNIHKAKEALDNFNLITKEFEKDTNLLIDLANTQLYQNIFDLGDNNDQSSQSLIFSFIIAVLLIGFSAFRFNTLHNYLYRQLTRAQNAEDDLQRVQTQLRKYNDDLEEEITKKTQELHCKIYAHSLSALPNRNKLLEDIPLDNYSYMAILNIDKFQSFNDVYGEEIGNIAIKLSADFLKSELINTSMYLYHIGGDEFVICSKEHPTLTNQIFIENIEQILKKFKDARFEHEDKSFQFIMSAGLAFDGKQKMLAYADMALKDAKKRNIQLSIFNEDNALEKTHQENIECTKKLLYAFENDGILSYFQPIVPIQDSSKETKYESLVRLRDEDGKIIPPFNFLKVAKANRIYYKITRAVISNTFAIIEKHKIACSLNFNLNDIENERSMKSFFELLDEFEHCELLTVELLETEDFQNYKLVYDFCVKVRSYGVKVALDDFGSGYSNFSHILQLPVDYIKIDASLISNIDRDLSSQIMVETIVELAHKLNIMTIAEFVSSEEILAVVKDLGVDYAQGYYLGKPLEISEYIN